MKSLRRIRYICLVWRTLRFYIRRIIRTSIFNRLRIIYGFNCITRYLGFRCINYLYRSVRRICRNISLIILLNLVSRYKSIIWLAFILDRCLGITWYTVRINTIRWQGKVIICYRILELCATWSIISCLLSGCSLSNFIGNRFYNFCTRWILIYSLRVFTLLIWSLCITVILAN